MDGMGKRTLASSWARAIGRSLTALNRQAVRANSRAVTQALKAPRLEAGRKAVTRPAAAKPLKVAGRPATPAGDWLQGLATGGGGSRRFHLYTPPGMKRGERLPLLVMLHGCGQTAQAFALSTRMNRLAARERFLVLYPEQDLRANSQGCWNWFETRSGRAWAEVELIMDAVDQVCLRHPVDSGRIAVAGLSAGASMAALLATRHPGRFKAVVMHSGVPPGAAHSAITALRAMRGRRAATPSVTPEALAAAAVPWPPLLVIHGRIDTVVAAINGRAAAELWARVAGAQATAERSVQRGQRYPMSVRDYKAGGRTVATLMEVQRLGHAWSGGAAAQAFSDGGGPDASRLLWAFVARQFNLAWARGTAPARPAPHGR
jgi:poly(hydroxyalkanoate) depolymerase family esterase